MLVACTPGISFYLYFGLHSCGYPMYTRHPGSHPVKRNAHITKLLAVNDWRRHQQRHQCTPHTNSKQKKKKKHSRLHAACHCILYEKWSVCEHASLDRSTLYWAIFPFNDLRPLLFDTLSNPRPSHPTGAVCLNPLPLHFMFSSVSVRRLHINYIIFWVSRARRWQQNETETTEKCVVVCINKWLQ